MAALPDPLAALTPWLALGALGLALVLVAGGGPLLRVLWVRLAQVALHARALAERLERDTTYLTGRLHGVDQTAAHLAGRLAAAGQALAAAQERLTALEARAGELLDTEAVQALIVGASQRDETNAAVAALHAHVTHLEATAETLRTTLGQLQTALSGQARQLGALAGEDQAHFHTYERRSQSQTEGRTRYVLVCTECAHRVVFLGPFPAALEQVLGPPTPPLRPMTRPPAAEGPPAGWSVWNPAAAGQEPTHADR